MPPGSDFGDTTFAELKNLQSKLQNEYKLTAVKPIERPGTGISHHYQQMMKARNSHSVSDLHGLEHKKSVNGLTNHISEQSADMPQKPAVNE